ncbi:putative Transmembrane amino acid transporter protein [Trypanosoma vivax]|nr:putative Transmembrane amino acid transporter protein [Trypanosoma vivax]
MNQPRTDPTEPFETPPPLPSAPTSTFSPRDTKSNSSDKCSDGFGIVPYGGTASNVLNLVSATLGAGIVLLPASFCDSGMIGASLLLLYCFMSTVFSIFILTLTKDKTGLRSYEEMAKGLLGNGLDYFTAFLMFVFCFGTCVGYVMSVRDLLAPVLSIKSMPEFFQSETGKSVAVACLWAVCMLPFSLPKEINALRYASAVGVLCIVFFVVCMIVHSAKNKFEGSSSGVTLVGSPLGFIRAFTFIVFAFICQVNCLEVHAEMRHPQPRRMMRDSAFAMLIVTILYLNAGIFGYLDAGNMIRGSVLPHYQVENIMIFGYIGIAIKLCVGFAICIHPSRDSIYYILKWGMTSDVPVVRNRVISAALATFALILALFLPQIEVVLAYLVVCAVASLHSSYLGCFTCILVTSRLKRLVVCITF